MMPHDSPMSMTLVRLSDAKDHGENSNEITPIQGQQMQVGWVNIGHFRRKTRYYPTRKRYKIDA